VDGISEITDEGNEVDVIYSDFLFWLELDSALQGLWFENGFQLIG
jgi:hypothetical protein